MLSLTPPRHTSTLRIPAEETGKNAAIDFRNVCCGERRAGQNRYRLRLDLQRATASLERRANALLAANAAPISDEKRYRLSDVSQRGEIDPLVEAMDELGARPVDERRHIAVEAEEARGLRP